MGRKRFDGKYDRSIREIADLQKELDQRTLIEQKAEELLRQYMFDEVIDY